MSFSKELVLNEARLKSAAAYLDKKISEISGEKLGRCSSLQLISQALFSKPYEEVTALIKRENQINEPTRIDVFPGETSPMFMAIYNDTAYLYNGSKIVFLTDNWSSAKNQDEWFRTISDLESKEYKVFNERVRVAGLPVILPDNPSTTDIYALCEKMGYIYYEYPFSEILFSSSLKFVMIDGFKASNLPSPEELLYLEDESSCDVDDYVIWSCEYIVGYDLYEFNFTFENICSAKMNADKSWTVEHNGKPVIVSFF